MRRFPNPVERSARRILFVERGEFSGINRGVRDALERAGCVVHTVRLSFRMLPWRPLRLLAMMLSAMLHYGRHFRLFLHRTPIASRTLSRAAKRAIVSHPEVDAVVFSGAAACRIPAIRNGAVPVALLTDHFNFLSKQLPDRGVDIPERRVHPTWNQVERAATESFDHVFVLSQNVRDAAVSEWALSPSRVSCIGAGSRRDLDVERDRDAKIFDGQQVLFVGKNRSSSGLKDVLAAFKEVRDSFSDATLHVVGGGTNVEQAGVVSHGTLEREELRQLFYDSQIVVLPSFREPFGLELLEGMWSKCVCIGSRTGATPDIIADGKTGYLVDPGDSTALAARMRALLAEPRRIARMAAAGYAEAKERWHWDQAAEQMLTQLFQHESEEALEHDEVA